jgi:hypothetical protein
MLALRRSMGVLWLSRSWTLGRILMACALAASVAACARIERAPVPASLVTKASIPGLAYARFWGDEVPKDVVAFVQTHMPGVKQMASRPAMEMGRPLVEYLALSGGADDGAFGAGLLVGWSSRGHRPKFEVVTGVSAGALIAPYAFLGSRYDRKLAELWTHFDFNSVGTPQVLAGLLGAESLVDSKPLRELIARHVDRRMLRDVAQEYRTGRVLMIGTTNLDAQRQVIWNMGEIATAAERDPNAVELFRDVLRIAARGVSARAHQGARRRSGVRGDARRRRADATGLPRARAILAAHLRQLLCAAADPARLRDPQRQAGA